MAHTQTVGVKYVVANAHRHLKHILQKQMKLLCLKMLQQQTVNTANNTLYSMTVMDLCLHKMMVAIMKLLENIIQHLFGIQILHIH